MTGRGVSQSTRRRERRRRLEAARRDRNRTEAGQNPDATPERTDQT